MNSGDIKREMRSIAEQMLDTADGVSWAPVVDAWRSTNAADLVDLGTDLLDSLLQRLAREVVKDLSNAGNSQLPLPGFGDIDTYVTTTTPEGGYLVKHIRHATRRDLVADSEIHDENVRKAVQARRKAQARNRTLIPVMEENGFETADEALVWLEAQG